MSANQQDLYLLDPKTLEFQATVVETLHLSDGRLGVMLDRSYFYPTGGGQEHDIGVLGEAQVIDVFKQGEPPVLVHVVDRSLPLGPVSGRVDADRRLRHMQHHTAQHLLTQCFVYLFSLDTLSANINGYSPSTLDLPGAAPSKEQLTQAENLANQLIYEDRPVHSYFVTPAELKKLPLRRAPKVSEDVRIVEIDGFDYTPCGGTHCTSTGQVGVLKFVKTEKQGERTRVHFVAGWQALQLFQFSFDTASGLAAELSISMQDLSALVLRQSEQLQAAQKELQGLRLEKISLEAEYLGAAAETIAGRRVVLADFTGRPVNELRLLGGELAKQPALISILASVDGQKLSLVIACGDGSGVIARDLLARLLGPFGGRGGGDVHLAQGGAASGSTSDLEKQVREIFDRA